MLKMAACLLALLTGLSSSFASADQAAPLILLSTQLRPIEEAQKMRNFVLSGFAEKVNYIAEQPQLFPNRIETELRTGVRTIDVIGALDGELRPLAALDALAPLDGLADKLKARGMSDPLLALGKLGTARQLYVPWMQAGYIMVANRQALAYLPDGANVEALTYNQLAAWAEALRQKTGRQLLGFPAGPQGLMHRFFEGFLYPSYTGGVVVPFRSDAAEAMWTQFAVLWTTVNPNSTKYNFMQQPLLSGEVWIGFDHIARLLDVLRQKPDEFIAFPAPAGPKGQGYLRVVAGLAMLKGAPNQAGSAALIDYLTETGTQLAAFRNLGFFPTVKVSLPSDFDPGLRMGSAAIEQMQSGDDALPASLPTDLGERAPEFDRIFRDTFEQIVLRGQKPRAVLDREAAILNRLMSETGAACWQPDPASAGPCQAR
jgi:multiple sugar transport system substrate-binding protein